MNGTFLNGGLDAILAAAKRLWGVGVFLLAAVGWVFMVNKDHADIQEIRQNTARIPIIERYQRDSLTTDSDTKFILAQTLAGFRKMDNRLRRMEGRPQQEGLGRWEYFEQYGPVPPRYRDWYEVPASQWLDAKAKGGRR